MTALTATQKKFVKALEDHRAQLKRDGVQVHGVGIGSKVVVTRTRKADGRVFTWAGSVTDFNTNPAHAALELRTSTEHTWIALGEDSTFSTTVARVGAAR